MPASSVTVVVAVTIMTSLAAGVAANEWTHGAVAEWVGFGHHHFLGNDADHCMTGHAMHHGPGACPHGHVDDPEADNGNRTTGGSGNG